MHATARRLLSIPFVFIALPLLITTAPLWSAVALIVDLSTGLRRFPTARLGLFAVAYLVHEWVGISASFVLMAVGRLIPRQRRRSRLRHLNRYRRVQAWWATSLLRWARRLLDVQLPVPDPSSLPTGRFIVLSRHASMVDAILPLHVIADRLDRFVHYVLKQELRWVPNIDIYGHALGNYFVARDGDSSSEAAAIATLAADAIDRSALVIFPEGTYATEARRARVRASLEARGTAEAAALALELQHLLPPKPAGTIALLRERPDADIVVFGHVGLEGVAELGGLRRRLPLRHPVVIEWWHIPRHQVPSEEAEMIAWLNDQWRTLDRWVGTMHSSRTRPTDRATDNISETA